MIKKNKRFWLRIFSFEVYPPEIPKEYPPQRPGWLEPMIFHFPFKKRSPESLNSGGIKSFIFGGGIP